MDRESILATLRAHAPELKAAGLLHLRLFGSVARGDDTPDSDVDLLFDSEGDDWNTIGLYDYEDNISGMLGAKAHLCSSRFMRPKIMQNALKESVFVF